MLDRRTVLKLGAAIVLCAPGIGAARATSIDTTLGPVQIIEVTLHIMRVDDTLEPLVTYQDLTPKLIAHIGRRLKDAGTDASVVDFDGFVEPRDVYPEQMIITWFRMDVQRAAVDGKPIILGAVGVELVKRGTEETAGVPVVSQSGAPMTLFTASDETLREECLKAIIAQSEVSVVQPYLILHGKPPQ